MICGSWREYARKIIERVISEYGHDEALLKKALHDAYPFGQRKWHPYKIWLDEIKVQTGKKKKKCAVVNEKQLDLL